MGQVQEQKANPLGLRGVDFIEFAGKDALHFEKLFKAWGFTPTAALKGKKIQLFQQNEISFILNTEPETFAAEFCEKHGPSVCSTGFIFEDAEAAFQLAVQKGARAYTGNDNKKAATPFPAVYGIGDSLIYFMDNKNIRRLYSEIFGLDLNQPRPQGLGFSLVDHFTNNVPVGEMQKWCDFYAKIFNFRETLYFDIKGKSTGLISKVMRSPCGTFAVPINEPSDKKSQIQEYLDEYKGSGIQHIALITKDIIKTVENLKKSSVDFLSPPPETYYRMLKDRLPGVQEDIERLRKNAILVDGDHDGYLLQIFSKNIIGPIFFEVIERKGHDGFGNGNFQALFDAIEQDQRERGYL